LHANYPGNGVSFARESTTKTAPFRAKRRRGHRWRRISPSWIRIMTVSSPQASKQRAQRAEARRRRSSSANRCLQRAPLPRGFFFWPTGSAARSATPEARQTAPVALPPVRNHECERLVTRTGQAPARKGRLWEPPPSDQPAAALEHCGAGLSRSHGAIPSRRRARDRSALRSMAGAGLGCVDKLP
jgi:hypothetical protein